MIVKHINERPNSLEIGTWESGCIKVYIDLADEAYSERRIRNAIRLRELIWSLSESVPAPATRPGNTTG